jgi:hypothetical protein
VRTFFALVFASVAALLLAAGAPARATFAKAQFDPPTLAELALGGSPLPVRDTLLSGSSRAFAARAAADWWGGSYTTTTGETVIIYTYDTYVVNQSANQALAEFFAGLVHGAELTRLTTYVAPLNIVQTICGSSDVAGCYSPDDEIMVLPGEDLTGGPTVAQVATHEYGHHVAENRDNPPWQAVDWGTKRWASRLDVCARAAAGSVFPGDEGDNYMLNPGEGFAEAYRVLNEARAGATTFEWPIVSDLFFPDQAALDALSLDVTEPWTQSTTSVARGKIARTGAATRRVSIATPLDGTLRVTLTAPAGALYRLALLDARGKVLAQGRSVTRTVCGEDSFQARVTRVRGGGAFSLRISRP